MGLSCDLARGAIGTLANLTILSAYIYMYKYTIMSLMKNKLLEI